MYISQAKQHVIATVSTFNSYCHCKMGQIWTCVRICPKCWLTQYKRNNRTIFFIELFCLCCKRFLSKAVDLPLGSQVAIRAYIVFCLQIGIKIVHDIYGSRYLMVGRVENIVKRPTTESATSKHKNADN